jgi:tetratricopeptide (TPR) repeat protein
MKRKSFYLFLFGLLLCAPKLYPQRQSQQEVTRADAIIHVTFEDDRPVPAMYRVQLMTGGRMPITEQFTNDRGEAIFSGLAAGSYLAIISATDIETSEMAFVIRNRETTHSDYLRAKRKTVAGQTGASTQGSVSAAYLNIPDKARKEFDKGLAAFAKPDYAVAREHFSKAVAIYPQYSAAILNLGVICMKEGKNDDGQQFFQRAITADPQNPGAYTYLARVYIMNAKYSEAEPLLTKAITITPTDAEPLTMLATSQLRSGKLELAVTTAKKVHSFPHEHYAVAHLVAAQALLEERLPELAAEEFRLFLKEVPTGPDAVGARAALQSIEHPGVK